MNIVMLGAAPETRGSIAAVVDGCRAGGLFSRWPIEYIATSCDGSYARQGALLAKAVRDFGLTLAHQGRVAVHVHARGGAAFWRDALFMSAALAARCPLLIQLHGTGFGREAGFFLERAAYVVVSCEAQRAWVRSVARNAQVVCVPPPVALQVAPEATRPNLVLYLGRLEAKKGIYELLDAISALRAAVPDVRLVCAGEGDRIGVARYAERLGIADAVKFTGWVGPSGKRALLENAAAFALPSYDEALPVSLIEAMSAGVPVVASPVGGIPEVVQEGRTGFLVAAGDAAGLERRLRSLLLDRALGARLGRAARESARLRFGAQRVLPQLEELYAALGILAQPRARPQPATLKKAA